MDINAIYQSSKVNVTESYNYLGVKMDSSLNLNEHFQTVLKKDSSRLLWKTQPYLTTVNCNWYLSSIYHTMIMYCSFNNYFSQPYRQNLLSLLERCVK